MSRDLNDNESNTETWHPARTNMAMVVGVLAWP